MSSKTKAQTFIDPHMGKITFRPLTPGQLRAAVEQVTTVDLDAEVARLGGIDVPEDELKRRVGLTLETRAILRRAIADETVRRRLGLVDVPVISEADGDAFLRIGAAVRKASGVAV